MPFQPHVDDDVAVVLVIVRDIEYQDRASHSVCRGDARTNRDRLIEGCVGGRFIDLVTVVEGLIQGLHERGLVGDLFVIRSGGWLLALGLRTEEEVGAHDMTNELTKSADLRCWPKSVLLNRHTCRRLCEIATDRRVHCFGDRRE